MGKTINIIILLIISTGCQNKSNTMQSLQLDENSKHIRDYVVDNAIIAHRGTTFWAPEETEAAYRWARNIGADYLEVDIQRSKDGVLLALHDNNLNRTTDCEELFPNDTSYQTGNYTYEELMKLDAGTWFNLAKPKQKRDAFSKDAPLFKINQKAYSFSGRNLSGELDTTLAIQHSSSKIYVGGKQYISTLEDVLMIAKGYRIARNEKGERLYNLIVKNSKPNYQFFYVKDEKDNGHRPGIYIETKEPELHPGVEFDLYQALKISGWNVAENLAKANEAFYKEGRVNTGNTNGKIVLQTFSPKSLQNLDIQFKGKIPVCLLLWLGDANMQKDDSSSYLGNINFAIQNNAHFIGPSIGGEPNNYADLLEEWQAKLIHQSGLKIHAYSFDTENQTEIYSERTDAMFTNRSELTIQ
ncbi:MAG: glycerophosphodiester phosphodiesterase family protein, partial [Bacteroidales bacterium]|nr:glycerophosphodiester phosphodiesterase family protein [Bacteroidales bacterium]